MDETEADYFYEVWRRGGNLDAVDPDDIPEDFDWVWDSPSPKHLPKGGTHRE